MASRALCMGVILLLPEPRALARTVFRVSLFHERALTKDVQKTTRCRTIV